MPNSNCLSLHRRDIHPRLATRPVEYLALAYRIVPAFRNPLCHSVDLTAHIHTFSPRTRISKPKLLYKPLSTSLSSYVMQPPNDHQYPQTGWLLKSAGDQSCTVCGKPYLIPRTEWVEWWHCLPSPSFRGGLGALRAGVTAIWGTRAIWQCRCLGEGAVGLALLWKSPKKGQ